MSTLPGTEPLTVDDDASRWSRLALLVWALGGSIRVFAQVVYWPSHLQWVDAVRYAQLGYWSGPFIDYWAPAGYATFLGLLRMVSSQLGFTIVCQHALGLATALLLASAARRAGVRAPWHLLPGAVVALVGDYVFLEHLLMPEALFLFLMTAGLLAAIRALAGDGRRWGVLAGLSFGVSALVRSNALPLLVLLGLCALPLPGSRRHAGTSGIGWGVACGAVLVVVYAAVATVFGSYTGLGDMTGWYLYGRTAPFADCGRMTVDDGSPDMSALCESTPADARFGPYYYTWEPASPARSRWHNNRGPDPAFDGTVIRFALDAIRRQPGDYIRAIALDMVRVVAPGFRPHAGNGQMMAAQSFAWRDEPLRESLESALSKKYSGTRVRRNERGAELLAAYQEATRLQGGSIVALVLAALAGLVRSSGTRRRQLLLVLLSGLCMLVVPILLVTWDFRYTLPATPVLALAAVLGFAPRTRVLASTAHAQADV